MLRIECYDIDQELCSGSGCSSAATWSATQEHLQPLRTIVELRAFVVRYFVWLYGAHIPNCGGYHVEPFYVAVRDMDLPEAPALINFHGRDLANIRKLAWDQLRSATSGYHYTRCDDRFWWFVGPNPDAQDTRIRCILDWLCTTAEPHRRGVIQQIATRHYLRISDFGRLERDDFEHSVIRHQFGDLGLSHIAMVEEPVLQESELEVPESTRTFGLEFEFLATQPQDDFAHALRRAFARRNIPFENGGYRHSEGFTWDLKTDSSCGLELCSPALTWERWSEVDLALTTLRDLRAEVDSRCGLHVHHACQDLKPTGIRRLMLLWMAYEKLLFGLVQRHRDNNRYCRSFEAYYTTWQSMKDSLTPLRNLEAEMQNSGKYRALNVSGWWQHGRVEVRVHHGTLNPGVVKFWTILTQQMVEIAHVTRDYQEMEDAFRQDLRQQVEQFQALLQNPKLGQVMEKMLLAYSPQYKELSHA